jgi:hypothetical protein
MSKRILTPMASGLLLAAFEDVKRAAHEYPDEMTAAIRQALEEIERLTKERDALAEAATKVAYFDGPGWHHVECVGEQFPDADCECGLNDLRAALAAVGKEKA